MRYRKFKIENFKGIKQAELDLTTQAGASVFPIVGLNESGKTTILQAIHSFAPDYRARSLNNDYDNNDEDAAKKRVPRDKFANFTGEILVQAEIIVEDGDRLSVQKFCSDEYGFAIKETDIPNIINVLKKDRFDRGDYIETIREFDFDIKVKSKGGRVYKPASHDQRKSIWHAMREFMPDIAYYSTFIFDFPEKIYLTNRVGSRDYYYRLVMGDVLAAGGQGFTLDDVRRRVRTNKYRLPWVEFFSSWSAGDDQGKIQQILDHAAQTVTENVFGKWNEIFGEDVRGKEVKIKWGVDEGRALSADKRSYVASDLHDIYVSFEIKDGIKRFPVSDRSLGFRWFFAFLLFTQFRVAKSSNRNVVFLFDEPAANLHAAAQQKLIESFPSIAAGGNVLIYSTHSHYMIDPTWLEQTYIVTNSADYPSAGIVQSALSGDDNLDIIATKYREFANAHPNKASYFQPIVDRLDVRPSKFDINLPSVVVEGKSDFYILEYAKILLKKDEIRIVPAFGSGSFGALMVLGAGWGTKFLFLLDSDSAGIKEKERYVHQYGARAEAIVCIGDVLDGCIEIENLIDSKSLDAIQTRLGLDKKPNKKQIQRYFQEQLAKQQVLPLSEAFSGRVKTLLDGLKSRLVGV